MKQRLLPVPASAPLLGLVSHPESHQVLVLTETDHGLAWFRVDVDSGATERMPFAGEGAVIFESHARHHVLTNLGELYAWPSGRRLAGRGEWAYPTSIVDPRQALCAARAHGVAHVTPEAPGTLTPWTAKDGPFGETAEAGSAIDLLPFGFIPGALVGRGDGTLLAISTSDLVVLVTPDGLVHRIDHEPTGHTVSGALHASEPFALILSSRAELLDLSTRRRIDSLDLGVADKLAATWHRNAFVIASHDRLWKYEPDSGDCVVLGTCPGTPLPRVVPSIATAAGDRLLVLRTEGLYVLDVDRERAGSARPAGRLGAHLRGAAGAEARVHARFGSASVVVEAAMGLDACGPDDVVCPACGATRRWRAFAPMGFETRRAVDDGPHVLRPHGYGDRSAGEYDESTFLTLHLGELLRGAPGATHLQRWLAALDDRLRDIQPKELFLWPEVEGTDADGMGIARPSIVLDTFGPLVVGLVLLPLRAHAGSTVPDARLSACRDAVRAVAESLRKVGTLLVLAPDGHPILARSEEGVFSWSEALRALELTAGHDARARRSVARWLAGITGAPFPSVAGSWDAAIEPRSRSFDFETTAFAYRNQWTLGAPLRVCDGCGWTDRGSRTGASRGAENAAVLDLLGELVSDRALSGRWLDSMNVGFRGEIARILCWPRLAQRASSPDAVFVSPDSLLVVEAKHPGTRITASSELARQILVRIANALFLAELADGRPEARVLLLAQARAPERLGHQLADLAWHEFEAAGHCVPRWSSSKPATAVYVSGPDDPIARRIDSLGAGGLRTMLSARTYDQATTSLARVAEALGSEVRATDTVSGAAYRSLRLRAEGFDAIRRVAR